MAAPESFCHYYNAESCKSCKWIEIPYPEQIQKKELRLRSALSFVANLKLEKTCMSKPTHFRNKAKTVVTGTTQHPVIGLTGTGTLDQGQELLDCPIHHPKLNELIQALPYFIQRYNLIPYQIDARKGELKGLILFYSEHSHELYLRFVLRSQECVSRIRKLLPELQSQFPELVCVSANLQPVPHAILEGIDEIFITEKNSIRHQLGGLSLSLSPKAFVQTNASVSTLLYQTAAMWMAEVKIKKMLELYCGQGAFSFFAAPQVEKIVGFEINEDAVITANETAQRLKFSHVTFVCADLTRPQLIKSELPDLILVNPPRRGIGKVGVELIQSVKPPFLIYSSCAAESLAQDLVLLCQDYEIVKIQIFDLFPNTSHFETLVLLKSVI